MKALLIALTFLTTLQTVAQTPVTNAYFPAIGDKLFTATAKRSTTQNVSITPKGGNQTWDFRLLQAQLIDTQRFSASNTEGVRNFPSANLTLQADSTRQIPFYRKTDSLIELQGYMGFLIQGYFIKTPVALTKPMIERRAPLKMGETLQHFWALKSAFPKEVVPDSLLRQSPFLVPDSVRITYDVKRRDTVDAWGIMRLPSGDFPVLRERRHDSIAAKVEVYFPGLAWVDVTTTVLTGLNEPFRNEQYFTYFWHTTTKEPIAIIETDSVNAVRNVQYKFVPQVGLARIDFGGQLSVFPNPMTDFVQVSLKNAPVDDYTVQLIDMSGRTILHQNIEQNAIYNLSVKYCLSGSYILYLLNKNGQVLTQKTLIKQ